MGATEPPAGSGHGVAAEPDRVSARAVVGFALVLTILGVAAMVLMAWLFHAFQNRAEKRDAASIKAAGLERRPESPPPAPRLQIHAASHWRDFRQAELERLETYGWMDRATGAVHIPIERAMELVVERGVGPLPPAPVAMPALPSPTPRPGVKR